VAQGDQSVVILVALVYLWVTTYRLYLLGFLRTELMVLFGLLAFALCGSWYPTSFQASVGSKESTNGRP
jgi:hypothetical protein